MRDKISTAVDLPLSDESQRVLAYAAEEADKSTPRYLGTEHLLLGLLREENTLAATLLHERGLSLERVRQDFITHGTDSSTSLGELLRSKLAAYLESHAHDLNIFLGGSSIHIKPDRSDAMPPFLVIEILSPTENLRDLRRRIDDDFARGLRYIWLLDPARARYMLPRLKRASKSSKATSCALKTPSSNSLSPKFSHNFTLVRSRQLRLPIR